jgi:hypothetical protein
VSEIEECTFHVGVIISPWVAQHKVQCVLSVTWMSSWTLEYVGPLELWTLVQSGTVAPKFLL